MKLKLIFFCFIKKTYSNDYCINFKAGINSMYKMTSKNFILLLFITYIQMDTTSWTHGNMFLVAVSSTHFCEISIWTIEISLCVGLPCFARISRNALLCRLYVWIVLLTLIVWRGGGQNTPCDAKFSEKCPYSLYNNTALIKPIFILP